MWWTVEFWSVNRPGWIIVTLYDRRVDKISRCSLYVLDLRPVTSPRRGQTLSKLGGRVGGRVNRRFSTTMKQSTKEARSVIVTDWKSGNLAKLKLWDKTNTVLTNPYYKVCDVCIIHCYTNHPNCKRWSCLLAFVLVITALTKRESKWHWHRIRLFLLRWVILSNFVILSTFDEDKACRQKICTFQGKQTEFSLN